MVLDFCGDTVPTVDTLPGGLAQLFGPSYQKRVDANTPATYRGQLDARRAPALWIDVAQSDAGALKEISGLVPLLKNKGYTVEFHTWPDAHDFTTFGNALAAALPWAAGRFFAA